MATTRVVGLDIGTTCVRAAELEFGRGGPGGKTVPTLVRLDQVPLPLGAVREGEVAQPAQVSGALRQLWQQGRFDSRDVVIGVGNQRVVVRELELPWMPLSQLKESLPFQVQELLPMSADEALLDYYPTGEVDGPQGRMVQGMLVAAQRDTVNANVLAVEGAGLRPRMVDLNAFAFVRALARGDLADRVVAFVDIGASITTVVISDRGVPRLARSLASGGHNVTQAIASTMGIAGAEAEGLKRQIGVGYTVAPELAAAAEVVNSMAQTLIEAIRNTFVYFGANHSSGIEAVVVTGGGAHLPGLGQYLSSASRLPVSLGDPFAGLKVAKSFPRDQLNGAESLVALAVGLAYGAAA